MHKTKEINLTSITENDRQEARGIVVRELPLTLFLNGKELVTTLCSPVDLNYLAAGILASEGLLQNKDDIKKLEVDATAGVVRVETKTDIKTEGGRLFKPLVASGGGKGSSSYKIDDIKSITVTDKKTRVLAKEVSTLVEDFLYRSSVYQATHGVHSAALCDNKGIFLFHDDIGRHNAIDKVFGECLLKDIPLDERFMITSGRISSEILLKIAKRKIPILVSKAAPTDLGVELAGKLGVTIVRYMKGKGVNVYSNDWRVVTDNAE
ncbi:formate dehydrogenase accessory sulfurtransferase FdhD [Chloroflexota bacterium]